MKNILIAETYRDEDGLIKQLRGRVKYVEKKSLLVQKGRGKVSVSDPQARQRGYGHPPMFKPELTLVELS